MTKIFSLKKAAIGLVMVSIIPFSAHAFDKHKAYVSLTGEYIVSSSVDIDFLGVSADLGNGGGARVALGYAFSDYFRGEFEGAYHRLNIDSEDESADGGFEEVSAMANIYLDIPTQSKITPYGGLGLGWAEGLEGDSSGGVAYQAMAGLNYKLNENSSVFAGYRYFGTSDLLVDIGSSAVDVGYKYNF